MNTALKMAILQSPLTQTDVAKLARKHVPAMSESRLSRIIHGHDPVASDEEKAAVARVLKRSVPELFAEIPA